MEENYFTIKENGCHEIEIKKSRFICHLKRVTTEEAAKEFIQTIKKEHWKAAHNCSAFTLGENQGIQRSSDDGEPSGTAGIPMLEVLKKREIINVVCVVTRYFGGIKLGAGGLIRAYGSAVSEAIDAIGMVEGKLQQAVTVTISYPLLGKIQHFLENSPYYLKEIQYTENVQVLCLIDKPAVEAFETEIIQLLNNQCQFQKSEITYYEIPLDKGANGAVKA